jgi:ATP-dependent DNA helicase RecG
VTVPAVSKTVAPSREPKHTTSHPQRQARLASRRRDVSPNRPLRPSDPVTVLPGVSRGVRERLQKLGVETVGQAATLFPRRFNDFTDVRNIGRLEPLPTPQTIVATIQSVQQRRFGRRLAGSEAFVTDGTGLLKIVWFNQPYIARSLNEGDRLVLSGKVRAYRGRLQMDNPEYEPFDAELMSTGRLVPVYPATQGLGQRTLRKVVKAALDAVADTIPDPVPAPTRAERGLRSLGEAIRSYHCPGGYGEAENARRRLALGEFLAVQAAVLQRRAEWQRESDAPLLPMGDWLSGFRASLGFPLTGAQERTLDEIIADLAQSRPMLRLLQGDVGSGKTVLAFAAMLAAVANGYQAALMVPTEILAEQHFRSLSRLLGGDDLSALNGLFAPPWFGRNIRAVLLTGSLSAAQKRQARGDAAHQGADVVIGTHAVLEDAVELPRLGLAVVDEQHRFGVMQRVRLRQKGQNPHLLVMTATPIPRTLALTVYGDLEVSVIDEMPPGRKPIQTRWVKPHERDDAYAFIRERLDSGEQVFVICPLVEDSEVLDARSAEEEFERLRSDPLREYRLELLHGRMPGRHKDDVMSRFSRGEIDVLVSTSVIEVGIDVPNATVIVIEGAERFGISQLHQFRGRVGRSGLQSHCLLFSTEDEPGPDARERLEAMVATNDGFKLAEIDLALRGEGEAWGKIQSGGNSMLRVARLSDRDILVEARAMAADILAGDPRLQRPENAALAAAAAPFLDRATEAN